MDALVKNLLWLGVEDYTGLWSAVFEVQATEGIARSSPAEYREKAREVLEFLLTEGLVDLFTCRWLDDDFVVVSPADRSALLRDETSWKAEEERALVWFATTDKGFDFYKKETGWE